MFFIFHVKCSFRSPDTYIFVKIAKVNFKIYDVTNRTMSNISRSKDNQTMKFGQLIENMRNIFLEKS